MAVCAAAAGLLGWSLVTTGQAAIPGGWERAIPAPKHAAFTADAWAHLASYATGILGGLVVVGYALRRRLRTSAA